MDYYFPDAASDSSEVVPERGHDTDSLAHPDLITFLAVAQKYDVEFVPVVWEEGRGLLGKGGTAFINQSMLYTHFPVDPSTEYDPLKNTASKETGFAFKRTSQYPHQNGVNEGLGLYEILTIELMVLRQQDVCDHPNIVNLEGICWEVTKANEVYPVLLFEKGNWGDLGSFAQGLQGGYCTFNAKLGFCIDIAKGLQVLHGLDIVHGDIKPQNVLLFTDDPDVKKYTSSGKAKLTDFGYSNFGALVYLTYSGIWSAPEYHDRAFEPSAGKKADIYSFGLTAVYLLFQWEVWDNFISLDVLKMRKYIEDGSMLRMLRSAVGEYYEDDVQRAPLLHFFELTLAHDAEARESNLESLIQLLKQARIISNVPVLSKSRFVSQPSAELVERIVSTQPALYESPPLPQLESGREGMVNVVEAAQSQRPPALQGTGGRVQRLLRRVFGHGVDVPRNSSESLVRPSETARSMDDEPRVIEIPRPLQTHLSWESVSHQVYSISKMIMALALSDYRVRQEICFEMAARLSENTDTFLGHCDTCLRRTAFQLALCHTLGFGIPKNHGKAIDYLVKSGQPESNLHDEISNIKQISGFGFTDLQSRPAKFVDDGIIVIWDFVDEYRRKGLELSKVQEYHLRELTDMKSVLSDDSDVVRMLKGVLAKLYTLRGNFKQVEELRRELLQTSINKYGDEGIETLHAKVDLGNILLETRQLTEAEDHLSAAFSGMRRTLGKRHLATLTAQAQWCETLSARGQHAETVPIYKEIFSELSDLLGAEHPEAITAMHNWASALGSSGDFSFSKTLHKCVLNHRINNLGPRHEQTLNSKTSVASALRRMGSYAEAEQMHQSALDDFGIVQGASPSTILDALQEFAITLEVQGKLQEAEILRERAHRPVLELQPEPGIEDDTV